MNPPCMYRESDGKRQCPNHTRLRCGCGLPICSRHRLKHILEYHIEPKESTE